MKLFCALALTLVAACAAAPQARIVGGDDVVLGQIPYQGALSIGGLFTCGAVILSENYALTAMRCVCSVGSDKTWPPQMFTVVAGTTDLYTGGQRISLSEITINPSYSDFNTGIALLRLSKPLVLSETVQPIALSNAIPAVGETVEISGFGRLKEGEEDMSRSLQLNDAIVVNTHECASVLGRSDSQVFCLGHARKNGICKGDFGGPAVFEGKLIGIAADVVGECGSYLPDVFISIAFNYDWIVEQMSN